MKKNFKQIITKVAIPVTALLLIVGCDNTDYSNKAPFDNNVYLDVASEATTSSITFNRTVSKQNKQFSAQLAYPAGTDITVTFAIEPELINVYNEKYGTQYAALPVQHYQLSTSNITIPAGKVTSNPVDILFKELDQLDIDATYLCPLTISSSNGADILEGSRTLWYLVKRSSAVTTAANLKNAYVTVPNFYVPQDGQPTATCVNNLTSVTYEAIIRVNSFDESTDISSIMGIEQYMCFRLGDASFPRQQLQFQGPDGSKFPTANKSKLLAPGEWYHIALTYDIPNKTIIFYVNGQEQSRSTEFGSDKIQTVSLGDKKLPKEDGSGGDFLFYIGRSYGERNDISRQLNGEICECRIWNVARTQDEIWKNMYDIAEPENDEHLVAYWKFNDGEGFSIKDHSRYKNDALIVPYWKNAEGTDIYELKESEVWPSGIEVPQLNK
ncbi:DUF1735 and LamG domain-containing protein [Bacteroides faecium]|uniref:DUF1735 domain-containing protein n=1 Tax=Bacteroides faecium TaxID=2715212 RepID=A0A6H0KVJ5_9BACE|nr:DUF1735 and LamG domain-containing protein [Bacteroides faecium]QIU96477.1 DUF1735 domain-containing protein [Bacteroides faecium]